MAEILLLRHGQTKGNLEGRYIGSRTDEPLCQEGIRLLQNCPFPPADRIYVSPMERCKETARLIWGESCQMEVVPELAECDFGAFENKNYTELNGNPAYQAWLDSNGTLPFPDGESMETFKKRCQAGFERIVRELPSGPFRAAAVVHGGTIMAVLERFGYPKRTYFDYQVKNGCGYLLTPVEGADVWNTQCWP